MQVDLNTNINPVQQSKLAEALSKLGGEEIAPKKLFGTKPSVTITNAPDMDLTKLVDRLNEESSDVKTNAAKRKMSGFFEIVIARARQMSEISQANMEHLSNAEKLSKQLEELDSDIKKNSELVNGKQNEISQLENSIKSLDKQIAAEKDASKRAELEQKRGALAETLETAKGELGALKEKGQALQTARKEVSQKIDSELKAIDNQSLLDIMAEELDVDLKDVANFMEDDKKERGEELEKYLDTHSPVRIIQDAIIRHDDRILEAIDKNRRLEV
ncbi:MAG: hypothetical protein MJ106_05740 [Lentisphaeria bacterium]|nr:hypothetical protein [Lentisphaeria bacterium]